VNDLKKLLLGNEAVARGAFEAGVRVASAYPGTPSTEITEFVAEYDEVFTEWAPNEKVALEVALGASVAGARSMCAMKHVGLNVAADPLFTASYTGVNGGLVVCVADDQGMHSSQNEQDSRSYAAASKTLMLEPSDSAECLAYMKQAYELSERYDTPVLLRLSTRVSHSRSLAETGERDDTPVKAYEKNPAKYVMMPGMARVRHSVVEKRLSDLREFAETSALNTVEYNAAPVAPDGKRIGVIAAGIAYQYAREALGERASYLKLGMIYPLPEALIKEFCFKVDICYVIEELEPFIENHCRRLGLDVAGKAVFTKALGALNDSARTAYEGEYDSELISRVVLGEATEKIALTESIPSRPPVMCAGCPHRSVFYALKQLNLTVSGDIGCYTLGALPPVMSMDTCVCMGASIGMAHGIQKAGGINGDPHTAVAVIGDSTFLHSGVTGLMDIVYNKGTSTVIILDNSITGMTGHQQNPATGLTIKGEPTRQVDLKKLCEALGVARVSVCDPFDLEAFKKLVKTEVDADEPSVIIAQRPCALLKTAKLSGRYVIARDNCKGCAQCTRHGCPAINTAGGRPFIDAAQCVGCGYCAVLCKFNCIKKEGE
jgi:indolepyruvate ferredoxin oxidoreductase alpha subunit